MLPQIPMSPQVLIAAGGTGGHIFPAILIGNAIKSCDPNSSVTYVSTGRAVERDVFGGAGLTSHVIPAVGIKKRGIKGIFEFILSFPKSLIATWRLVSKVKPTIVVGVGGYVTFFPVLVASFRGIPTWIHEAEINPGLTNSILSLFATRISTAHRDTKFPFRNSGIVYTGHPLKHEFLEIGAGEATGIIPKNILITGGSQGARAIDEGALSLAPIFKEKNLSVLHQCRPENFQFVADEYAKRGISAKVVPFISNMVEAYRNAHIVICRAGAGTVAEIAIVNRPAIFVPLSTAAGNEQYKNAKTIVDAGKALLVEEGPRFTERLKEALLTVLDINFYNDMKVRVRCINNADAADRIAKLCLELCDGKSTKQI